MRDYQRSLALDFTLIGEAQTYYEQAGYQPIAVPWVIDEKYVAETKPDGVEFYSTLGGVLVASAEQSFIQMLDQGWDEPGSYQATTPCYRDEDHDELHSPYFMKTELFDNKNVTVERLHKMINTALNFFNSLQPGCAEVEDLGDGTFDIVSSNTKTELGSYGIRERKNFTWVYGTGIALPRFEQAVTQDKKGQANLVPNFGRAISPTEAKKFKVETIPAVVFDAVNELLSLNLSSGRAHISQPQLVEKITSKGIARADIFANNWLSFSPVYEAQGWKVVYDRPAYNESGEAHWVFTEK